MELMRVVKFIYKSDEFFSLICDYVAACVVFKLIVVVVLFVVVAFLG